jgi:hypothetical protein
MNKKRGKGVAFVKYYPQFSALFNPAETCFILHMVHYEFIKSVGFQIHWTRGEYAERMGLKECAFKRCAKRLSAMNLLKISHNPEGNRVFYEFNMSLYNRLVEILSATTDMDKLVIFCDTHFKKTYRRIESISDDEIKLLKD